MGQETAVLLSNYEYSDFNHIPGKYLYRLKQIDIDGSFEYSPEVEIEISSPSKFSLSQNYPNPFNPTTKISWQTAAAGLHTLKVYDIAGNEVATLVNEYKPAGIHEIEFDAANLSSGIYFYKLQSGNFVETKKMILLR